MGRRKIEMKRIEDKSSRQVTFSKRRSGLVKKARELSVLCDVDVAVLVFSTRGRVYEFFSGSSSTSLSQVLKRYQDCTTDGKALMDVEERGQSSPTSYSEIQTCGELVKTVERYLEGPDVDNLSLDDFMQLEKQLADALVQTRTRKTQLVLESLVSLQEQEKILKQENDQLKDKVTNLVGVSNEQQLKDKVTNLIGNSKGGNPPDIGLLNDVTDVDAPLLFPQPTKTLPLLW